MTIHAGWLFLFVVVMAAVFVGGVYVGVPIGMNNHEWDVYLDNTGCTYVEVAKPDIESGMTWVIGWKKECKNLDGDWVTGPLIEFGPEQSAAEALLLWEKRLGVSGFTGGDDG